MRVGLWVDTSIGSGEGSMFRPLSIGVLWSAWGFRYDFGVGTGTSPPRLTDCVQKLTASGAHAYALENIVALPSVSDTLEVTMTHTGCR